MNLDRTPLLLETGVPVGWPTRTGYPPPGVTRAKGYPAGDNTKKGEPGIPTHDAEYDCSSEGKKIAKSQAWMFPSKRVKVCGKVLKT